MRSVWFLRLEIQPYPPDYAKRRSGTPPLNATMSVKHWVSSIGPPRRGRRGHFSTVLCWIAVARRRSAPGQIDSRLDRALRPARLTGILAPA
jgi:hypothetical protein